MNLIHGIIARFMRCVQVLGALGGSFYSVPNRVDAPKDRFMTACFDLENEYNTVLSARYAEKQQFCSPPGAVNTVGDTIQS